MYSYRWRTTVNLFTSTLKSWRRVVLLDIREVAIVKASRQLIPSHCYSWLMSLFFRHFLTSRLLDFHLTTNTDWYHSMPWEVHRTRFAWQCAMAGLAVTLHTKSRSTIRTVSKWVKHVKENKKCFITWRKHVTTFLNQIICVHHIILSQILNLKWSWCGSNLSV